MASSHKLNSMEKKDLIKELAAYGVYIHDPEDWTMEELESELKTVRQMHRCN